MKQGRPGGRPHTHTHHTMTGRTVEAHGWRFVLPALAPPGGACRTAGTGAGGANDERR